MHQTGICNSHEVLVMPTCSMAPADKDYAISFSVPTDTEGILMIIGRQSCDTRKLEGSQMDVGNSVYGGLRPLSYSTTCSCPTSASSSTGDGFRRNACGAFRRIPQTELRRMQGRRGRRAHRAAALAAQYNGADRASHVKDKLIEMTHLNETIFSCGIACSAQGCWTASGGYMIDLLLCQRLQAERDQVPL